MGRPRVVIVRAPGINCDEETDRAWQLAGADSTIVHLNRLVESPALLDRYDVLTIPGGFSYGDDVSAGRIFANRIVHTLSDRLRAFLEGDRLVLGICNGFQILVKAGLLVANESGGRCTLTLNASGKFVCRWVSLTCESNRCLFLARDRTYFLPIAHAEGRFDVDDPVAFDRERRALRYVDEHSRVGPANPNGSFENVAALTDSTGKVLGMMPHPERFVRSTQHPHWTAGTSVSDPDGLSIFQTAVGRLR